MKKLWVILLATVFVLGFTVKDGAGFEWVTADEKDNVFDVNNGDVLIDFNDVLWWDEIDPENYELSYLSYGVESIVGYGDRLSSLSARYFGGPGVTNLYLNDWAGTGPYQHPAIRVNFAETITRVGFDAGVLGTTITVKAFRGGDFTDEKVHTFDPRPDEDFDFIGIKDSDGIDAIEITGSYLMPSGVDAVFIDNLIFGGAADTAPIDVNVEIKPPNCLGAKIPIDNKRINDKSRGVTPVVIVGDGTYDVTEIDPSTVLLQGVTPVRDAIEDASHCNAEGGDGVLDLTLKFNTQELVEAMEISPAEREAVKNGEWPSKPLQISGNLFEESGGRAIMGEVSVTLVGKLKPEKENRGKGSRHWSDRHQRHDRGHHHGWHKSHGQHKHHGWDNH